jgi:hypothetical protein
LALALGWIMLVLHGLEGFIAGGLLGLLLGFIYINVIRLKRYSSR